MLLNALSDEKMALVAKYDAGDRSQECRAAHKEHVRANPNPTPKPKVAASGEKKKAAAKAPAKNKKAKGKK